MQTFLPYCEFSRTAKVLDYRRLGKQRVEVLQILNVLSGNSNGWKNHPAVRMWEGYTNCLVDYGRAICLEWRRRGYKDTCLDKISSFQTGNVTDLPYWLFDKRVHLSHKSNLLRKFPEHYRKFWPKLADDLPYYWPL